MEQLMPTERAVLPEAGAGFGIRFAARMLDNVFGIMLGFGVGIVTGIGLAIMAQTGHLDHHWLQRIQGIHLESMVTGLIAATLYHTLCEGMHGSSLGKLCCGLRVIQRDGQPCTMRAAFGRSLAYIVDSFFFGLVGLSSMQKSALNQRYGDVWCNTVVVKAADYPELTQRTMEQFAMAFVLAILVQAAVLGLGIVVLAL